DPIDKGRFDVTKDPNDLYVFRVASLRNVAMTPPYFPRRIGGDAAGRCEGHGACAARGEFERCRHRRHRGVPAKPDGRAAGEFCHGPGSSVRRRCAGEMTGPGEQCTRMRRPRKAILMPATDAPEKLC